MRAKDRPAAMVALIRSAGASTRAIRKNKLVKGNVETIEYRSVRRSRHTATGTTMAAALTNAEKTSTRASAAISRRREKRPSEDRTGSFTRLRAGAIARIPTLSWGHAFTQSRQNV